jgi:acetyltransferase-like isoleucine patch superfamily enzyme
MVGDGSRMHSNCFVPEFTNIGKRCWIGPNTVFTNAKYPNRDDTKEKLTPVKIEDDVIIGASVTVLPGCVIGRGAFIGAGTLVTKNVDPYQLVYGNPATASGNLCR